MEQFNNIFATYNLVTPPEIEEDFFNTTKVEDNYINPVSETYTSYIAPKQETLKEELEETNPVKKTTSKKTLTKPRTQLTGSAEFEQAFALAVREDPSIAKYKNFLTRTALKESGFRSRVLNGAGAPYYGYFQFGEAALRETSNLSMEEFRNNPVEQIKAAAKLYQSYIRQAKALGIYDEARSKGYSDDAIAAGAWLGGVGGVRRFIRNQGDPSDSHHYQRAGKSGGTTVGTRMREFNNG